MEGIERFGSLDSIVSIKMVIANYRVLTTPGVAA